MVDKLQGVSGRYHGEDGQEAGRTESVQDTVDAKSETEDGETGAEPYIITVRKLDEVRLEGKAAEDFQITNTANDFGIYYVDDEGNLYACRGYRRFLGEDEDGVIQLIVRNGEKR